MQSTATDVDAYLAEVPPNRRDILTSIRQLCLANLPGFTESMEYGMPCYARDGVVKVAFASQKNYISLYGLKNDAFEARRADFAGASTGKGCIRYTKLEKIDLGAVELLLKATASSGGRVC